MSQRRPKRKQTSLPVRRSKPRQGEILSVSSVSSFKLVPDVLGLIALQMDHPADFASFSLTCSAWYQATVDNAHLFQFKIYQCNIRVWDVYRSQKLQTVTRPLDHINDEHLLKFELRRRHGSHLYQVTVDRRGYDQYIISETVEGYWLIFQSTNPYWHMLLYSVEFQYMAGFYPCHMMGQSNLQTWTDRIVVYYPMCVLDVNENTTMEEQFRSWTSVQEFVTYSCELLRSLPSSTSVTKTDRDKPTDEFTAFGNLARVFWY